MKRIIFIALFFMSINGFSKENPIDSLSRLIEYNVEDTNQINTHIALAKEYIDINVDSTLHYIKKALEPSEKLNYTKGILKVNNILGNCAQRKGDFDEAMRYYEKAKALAISTDDDKGMAIVLNNIGIIYTQSGEYNKALESYLEAVDYEIIVGDKKGIAEGYNNIGVVHYYMRDMENTLVYLKKSMEITEEIGDFKVLKKGYLNIGSIHMYNKEFEEALEFYQKALIISKDLNDQNEITICYQNIAGAYAEQGKYAEAERYYLEAQEFHKKFNNKRGLALNYINIGRFFKLQKQNNKAKSHYEEAIQICREGGFRKELEAAYSGLAEIYADMGDHKKAFEILKVFTILKDSLVNVENSKNFAELRTQYETAEKEKALAEEKIKTETLGKEKAEIELKAANRSKWIITLLGLVIAAVLIFLVVVQKNKRRAQAEKDAALLAERDKGTHAVFEAQEEERKRISKDLHDGVGQQLSGMKMAFQKLGKELIEKLPEKVDDIAKLTEVLDESANEVRSISHQMMPRALSELGIISAIDDMLAKSLRLSDINYEFDHFGIEERLAEKVEVSLYRVAQELINNIIKHSQATQVNVQLFRNQNKVILVIEDNGTGIKPSKSDGHGLLNIKSRVNTLRGELNLEPSPNSGTLATVRIPIT